MRLAEITTAFSQHIDLTLAALSLSVLLALPVGFYLSRHEKLSAFIVGVFGLIYTLPSLALFALLIPALGLGFQTALLALVLYSQFILLRNFILGFQSVDATILDAAKGMGMNAWQLFKQIEFPLALPMILGGVRLAAVTIAGLATIAAWVNAGGLGVILFEGIYRNDIQRLLIGTGLSAGFTLALNAFLVSFEQDAWANARGELT